MTSEGEGRPREDREIVDVSLLQGRLRDFVAERDWEQFHTPKNLSMALAAEAGELLEIFQWLTDEQSRQIGSTDDIALVRDELADILVYVARLADLLRLDLPKAVEAKLAANAEKYPVKLAKGNAVKYTRRTGKSEDTP